MVDTKPSKRTPPVRKMTKEEIDKTASDVFDKGMLPKDAMGISDAMMEGIYGQAYHMYNSGKYQEAGQLFRLLVMLNATEPKYMLGLAGCYHLEKEYENAILVYALVEVLAPNDPAPYYHSADCYMQLQAPKLAKEQLEGALKLCGDKREYRVLKDRVEAALRGFAPEVAPKTAAPIEAKGKR